MRFKISHFDELIRKIENVIENDEYSSTLRFPDDYFESGIWFNASELDDNDLIDLKLLHLFLCCKYHQCLRDPGRYKKMKDKGFLMLFPWNAIYDNLYFTKERTIYLADILEHRLLLIETRK